MDFAERVAALSALADPARLRIVDVLDAGDASPGELRTHLDLPSNLVAHHLKVLEEAGVVSRHRSHADRRRTYLRLHRERLAGLLPSVALHVRPVARVVFVCTANSARSQLAAAAWRQASPIPVTSGGTHPSSRIAPGAAAAARRHHLSLVQQRPQPLAGLLRDGDYVVTVCDAAHEELGPAAMAAREQVDLAGVTHWSVPDPVAAGSRAAFDAAYAEVAERVADLSPRLVAAT
ncbi:protein-tyrosine-phosphatase/DNA-binding transcriptional ArsR family regulator [Nocardioides sp. BE266]|uniref:arsenate reductase/protein-tyrosine-phosphatase family protein n=1 Tax=Nocardioides sp. BE266 TaxID=2817725 RepID=UPI002855F5B2|nr:helix-turn-helix domain-containing protein [Nocardioides sp. BE266]MDR7253252.1 protein-tyrosine-phosphatase/DNA-binding transcriptional ArsR family regulator [Nocardioides sp. BE266]